MTSKLTNHNGLPFGMLGKLGKLVKRISENFNSIYLCFCACLFLQILPHSARMQNLPSLAGLGSHLNFPKKKSNQPIVDMMLGH